MLIKAPFAGQHSIAGADGSIDKSEIKGAINTTRKKTKVTPR